MKLSLEKLKQQEVARIEVDGEGVLVIAGEDGEVYALRDLCPHAEASMYNGSQEQGVWFCPWHGAGFDLKTGACRTAQTSSGPRWCVKTYTVTIDGDEVIISGQD